MFVDSIKVFDCRLSGVLNPLEMAAAGNFLTILHAQQILPKPQNNAKIRKQKNRLLGISALAAT